MTGELRMGRSEWLLLFGLAAIWGSSFPFYKIMVAQIPPMTIALGRTAIAALALNLVLRARGERIAATRWDAFWFLICGILNNALPFSLIAFGEIRLSAGLASILNATTPIFGILVAHMLTHNERLTGPRLAGVLLGFGGVAVLLGPGLFDSGAAGSGGRLLAEAACLSSAVAYAFGGVFSRRLSGHSALRIATGQATAAALVMIPLVVVFDRPWTMPMPGPAALLSLAAIGLACTALAYVMYFRIMRVAGATNMLLVTLLVPVSALILAALLLGETLRPNAFAGMALIALGLVAIDGRVFRRVRMLNTTRS
ncbi:DMT family transporter [Acidiphilium sp. AL]|uniref:DMT family transporter n=1 Tax=Acidiphilium sp. AL TaxID=2871704 RepID=UPI0021CB24CD|nr:DMT family transporter [Acidiphilium sp. AL]